MDLYLVLNRSFPGSINDSIIFYIPLVIVLDVADFEILETFPKLPIFQKVEYDGIKT